MTPRPQLPVDPETSSSPATLLTPGNLALVILGGMLGSLARELLRVLIVVTELMSRSAAANLATLIANITGALFLGFLISLLSSGNYPGQSRWRLLLGTGLAGGFTTFSTLAFTVGQYLQVGEVLVAVGYGLGTVLIGGLATYIGILLGPRIGGKTS